MKLSKVRRTDYRPTGLDRLASSQAHEAAMHDAAVAQYPPHLVDSAMADLERRGPVANSHDHETRWVMQRKAALKRRAAQLSTPLSK